MRKKIEKKRDQRDLSAHQSRTSDHANGEAFISCASRGAEMFAKEPVKFF